MTIAEAQLAITQVNNWSIDRSSGTIRLVRQFDFASMKTANEFVLLVEREAEIQNHHPRIVVVKNSITIEWWTHVIDGLHNNDFIMAAKTDAIFGTFV